MLYFGEAKVKQTRMDDISPEEWARYTGDGGGGNFYSDYQPIEPPSTSKGKEEYYDDDDPAPMSLSNDFVVKKKVKRSVSFQQQQHNGYYGGGGDDVIQREIVREKPDLNKLFIEAEGFTGFNAPIERSGELKRIIPYNVCHGAKLLLAAHGDGDIRLGNEAVMQLRKLSACDDEYTATDPTVVIWDTLSTGTCKIYVQEVVPISVLLLARHFDLHYTITIMEDTESKPRPFTGVNVEPYYGQRVEGPPPLGCALAVKQRMAREPAAKTRLVEIFMLRIGALSPETACDGEWIETQTELIGKVLNRQSLAAPERPPLGGGPGTGKPPIERDD